MNLEKPHLQVVIDCLVMMLKFGLCETNFAFVTEIHCVFLMCTGVMLSPLNLAKSRMAMKQKETLRQTNFSASKQPQQPARSGESQHNNNGITLCY